MDTSEIDDAGKWLIYIAGSAKMQGELMAVFIEKETGLPCRVESCDSLFPQTLVSGRCSIILSDCRSRSAKSLLTDMRAFKQRSQTDVFIIFFNIKMSLEIEEELLGMGIWGVFYDEDPPGNLPLGIEAIRKGEIWLSRQVMSRCLINMRYRQNTKVKNKPDSFTKRELKILNLLKDELPNDHIASRLSVSVYTVRAHLYRIYRKIGVSDYSQAVIWARQNM